MLSSAWPIVSPGYVNVSTQWYLKQNHTGVRVVTAADGGSD